jgi:hypothetical protein
MRRISDALENVIAITKFTFEPTGASPAPPPGQEIRLRRCDHHQQHSNTQEQLP